MNEAPDWANLSGDIWARRWRDTDRGLSELGAELDAAILDAAPSGPFRALDIGCGPGSTSLELAGTRPDATIVACDLSPALVQLAESRLASAANVRVLLGDAAEVARSDGPFDLVFSRHGVMFFDDPVRAFRDIRAATAAGGELVFSCFRDWAQNPWASELVEAAAGRELPPPGREAGGFAFSDPDYVRALLHQAGWADAAARPVAFRYLAGDGDDAVEHALGFFSNLGPASRVLAGLPESERAAGLKRMRRAIERQFDGVSVTFPAAAWIWSARAASG